MDGWPYWMFEENIKIVNELSDEEEKQRKKQEDDQSKSSPNFNPSQYMSSMNSMMSGIKTS